VGVEARERVLFLEHVLKVSHVVREVLGRDGRILDEGDVLGVRGSGEQDRCRALAELPEFGAVVGRVGLEGVERADGVRIGSRLSCSRAAVGFRRARVGQSIREHRRYFRASVVLALGVELDEQRRLGSFGKVRRDVGELLGIPGELEQHVVDRLDRRGVEVPDDGVDVGHRLEQILVGQQDDARRLGDRLERDGRLRHHAERSLAPGEDAGEVDRRVGVGFAVDCNRLVRVFVERLRVAVGFRDESVEVVAGDVPLELREDLADRRGFLVDDPAQCFVDPLEQLSSGSARSRSSATVTSPKHSTEPSARTTSTSST